MNLKKISIAALFAALSLGALSAQAQDTVKVQNYMYGDHLDIARVLSTDEGAGGCGVVNASMTYLDSMGQKQVLNYRAIGQNCAQDN